MFISTGNWRGGAEGKPKSNALYFLHELFRPGREIETYERGELKLRELTGSRKELYLSQV